MTPLVEFLLARTAEDSEHGRRRSRRLAERRHGVLRRIAADRLSPSLARAITASIVKSYADHPDYRDEWRP